MATDATNKVEEDKSDDTMKFTQIQGLNKTYAHYLLFKEDSPTLVTVIDKLEQTNAKTKGYIKMFNKPLFITLLGIRNREHIRAALNVFGFFESEKTFGGFDKSKYLEMSKYANLNSDFINRYKKEMEEGASIVNLIHELVINYYPADGSLAVADTTNKDILNNARANLRTSLKSGYYKGSNLIDKEFAETTKQPADLDALGKLDIFADDKKRGALIEKAKKHYEQHSNLDRNLSAVASLYADAHRVNVGQALQVVATAHANGGASASGADTMINKSVDFDFVLANNNKVKINAIDYGASITVDGANYTNRCFLLALAHGLDIDPVVFYRKILKLFKPENTDKWKNSTHKDYKTKDDIENFLEKNNDKINEIKEKYKQGNNEVKQNMVDNNDVAISTNSSEIINFPKTLTQNEFELINYELRYITVRSAILGKDYINLPEFFAFVFINDVVNKGLVCLILNNETINVNADITTKDALIGASTKQGEELENYKKYLREYKNDQVVEYIGKDKITKKNTIFLINDGGHFYLANIKNNNDDIYETIMNKLKDTNGTRDVGGNLGELKYDEQAGGFKRSAHKTKKRGGRLHRKTHRRK